METTEKHNKVLELRSKLKIKEEERNLKQLEITALNKELFDAEWVKFTWQELESWLKENRPENDYEKNPVISNSSGWHKTYCKLTDTDELQVGPYYNHDNFPRGKDLYVAYDFRNWR